MAMSEVIIDVQGLSKHYPPNIKAVDDMTLRIERGRIFSMLGPNGAGKTTTVEILEGLRNPTSGKATIFGVDVTKDYSKLRDRVGILPQNFEPFDNLKPIEAVRYWAGLYDMKTTTEQLDALLGQVGLAERKSILSRKLSGGEKRKLGIALSLINEPEVLFLDEPTTGLDPKARRDLWKLIQEIRDKGTTVFLTTHYLDEAEKLADDVAIMNKGKIVARGSPQELITKYGKMTVIVISGAGQEALKEITRRGIKATEENGDVLVPVKDPAEMRMVFQKISGIELKARDIFTRRQSLEDVFLNLVGAKMHEGVLTE
jgi:ABC-2 type transport system ATP-binding protein